MKKLSITVRASIIGALIAGLFALSSAFVPIVFKKKNILENELITSELLSEDIINEAEIQNIDDSVYTMKNELPDNSKKGLGLLTKILPISIGKEIQRSGWIDLLGNKETHEYFAIFHSLGEEFTYLAIISTRNEKEELIFYDKADVFDSLNIDFFGIDEKPYSIVSTCGGSAHCLCFEIFEYNTLYGFRKVLSKGGGWDRGVYSIVNGKMVFEGNSQKYILSNNKGNLSIIKLSSNIEGNSYSASHVLSFLADKSQIIYYDKNPLVFKKNERRAFELVKPIDITIDDLVIIDETMEINNGGAIKYFLSEDYEILHGYNEAIRFTKKGIVEFQVRGNFYDWYYITFNVSD